MRHIVLALCFLAVAIVNYQFGYRNGKGEGYVIGRAASFEHVRTIKEIMDHTINICEQANKEKK